MSTPTKSYLIDSFPPPTLDEIKEFEARNRVVLPEQYVQFLLVTNGGSFSGDDCPTIGIPDEAIYGICFLYGLNVPFDYFEIQDTLDSAREIYPAIGKRKFIPIGADPFGNQYCLKVAKKNSSEVWFLDHETGLPECKIANTFNEFLDNIYVQPSDEPSEICRIVVEGRVEELEELLAKGAVDFNEENRYGLNLLSLAATQCQPKVCRVLLQAGFDVDKKSSYDGATALKVAHSVDAIKMLIEWGADVNAKSRDGETPLMYCIKYEYEMEAIELLKHGASLLGVDEQKLARCEHVARYLKDPSKF